MAQKARRRLAPPLDAGGQMSLFQSLFGKRSKRSLEDSDFGRINERKPNNWEGNNFELWGYSSIQVILDGTPEGPTPEQRSFIKALRTNPEEIRERIERVVEQEARETASKPGSLKLTSIYLPEIPPDQMWRVWYDVEQEDHYCYGAEIKGWQHIVPFTED